MALNYSIKLSSLSLVTAVLSGQCVAVNFVFLFCKNPAEIVVMLKTAYKKDSYRFVLLQSYPFRARCDWRDHQNWVCMTSSILVSLVFFMATVIRRHVALNVLSAQ